MVVSPPQLIQSSGVYVCVCDDPSGYYLYGGDDGGGGDGLNLGRDFLNGDGGGGGWRRSGSVGRRHGGMRRRR